jgi:hypothetical protein
VFASSLPIGGPRLPSVIESVASLPLRAQKIDVFFATTFLAFARASAISNLVPISALLRGQNWILLPCVLIPLASLIRIRKRRPFGPRS